MRRGLVLTLIAVHGLAVATLVVAVGWTHSKPRPCLATFERVQEGMTRAEVVATVGGPPGSYLSRRLFPLPHNGDTTESWLSDDATLEVSFDTAGAVNYVAVTPCQSLIRPKRWERLLRWMTTGNDVPRFLWISAGPYDLGTLRDILSR